MAMVYMYQEGLGFVMEHLRLYLGKARVIWDLDEDKRDFGEVMEARHKETQWC